MLVKFLFCCSSLLMILGSARGDDIQTARVGFPIVLTTGSYVGAGSASSAGFTIDFPSTPLLDPIVGFAVTPSALSAAYTIASISTFTSTDIVDVRITCATTDELQIDTLQVDGTVWIGQSMQWLDSVCALSSYDPHGACATSYTWTKPAPTSLPSGSPTESPTAPTSIPTVTPTSTPTAVPSLIPTAVPTSTPTTAPTVASTPVPTTPVDGFLIRLKTGSYSGAGAAVTAFAIDFPSNAALTPVPTFLIAPTAKSTWYTVASVTSFESNEIDSVRITTTTTDQLQVDKLSVNGIEWIGESMQWLDLVCAVSAYEPNGACASSATWTKPAPTSVPSSSPSFSPTAPTEVPTFAPTFPTAMPSTTPTTFTPAPTLTPSSHVPTNVPSTGPTTVAALMATRGGSGGSESESSVVIYIVVAVVTVLVIVGLICLVVSCKKNKYPKKGYILPTKVLPVEVRPSKSKESIDTECVHASSKSVPAVDDEENYGQELVRQHSNDLSFSEAGAVATVKANAHANPAHGLFSSHLGIKMAAKVSSKMAKAKERVKFPDAFLSHCWGPDELERDNHARVRVINKALQAMGTTTWFDEEKMEGNVTAAMAEGIDSCSTVLVFVTKRYIEKAAVQNDNCGIEFNYSIMRKKPMQIIPVVLEEDMLRKENWKGSVGAYLGNVLYLNMSFDFPEAATPPAGSSGKSAKSGESGSVKSVKKKISSASSMKTVDEGDKREELEDVENEEDAGTPRTEEEKKFDTAMQDLATRIGKVSAQMKADQLFESTKSAREAMDSKRESMRSEKSERSGMGESSKNSSMRSRKGD